VSGIVAPSLVALLLLLLLLLLLAPGGLGIVLGALAISAVVIAVDRFVHRGTAIVCHHRPVSRPERIAALHAAVVVGIWAGLAPTALVRDDTGALVVDWRPWPFVVLGVAVLLAGSVFVHEAGRQLTAAGAHVFTTRPGPRLVTEGWYARVRNPQEIGTMFVALAPPIALAPTITWVIPLIAAVYLGVALGPYEERRLLEAFGDDYEDYRRRVRRWVPS
jgi:protein-S-isoprenylcysteine O-methyltransferase Ste14